MGFIKKKRTGRGNPIRFFGGTLGECHILTGCDSFLRSSESRRPLSS